MNKIIIITGASSGIGFELAKNLFNLGYIIIFACRNKEKTLEKMDSIKFNSNRLIFLELDLNSITSINNFCDSVTSKYAVLELLVNNAGMPATKRLTEIQINQKNFNINQSFMVNFLGHYILFNKLKSKMKINKVVNISSVMHWYNDDNFEKIFTRDNNYNLSKLAMIYFTNKINKETNIKAYSFNPGYVDTGIWDYGKNKNGSLYNCFENGIRKLCSITPEQSSIILSEVCLVDHEKTYISPYNDTFLPSMINEIFGKFIHGSNITNFPDTSELSRNVNKQKKFFNLIKEVLLY